MGRLSGTQTELNLLKAFASESQAKNRYTYFSKIAKKEGFVQVANVFLETALHEESHGKRFFKFLDSAEGIEITATFLGGKLGTTIENLALAAKGEGDEWRNLYPHYAAVAEAEGFKDVANAFHYISEVEKEHETRFLALYENMAKGITFKKETPTRWHCIKCGYIVEALEAPQICPACLHPQAYFEIAADNY